MRMILAATLAIVPLLAKDNDSVKRALRGTVLTRTDSGGETLSTWRIGSDYGSAFLSNMWYPERLSTARLGFIQGSLTLGFDLAGNLAAEFWPDIKRKVLRRK
jgi:hypothetical protein